MPSRATVAVSAMRDLGATLIDRSGRVASLTGAGAAALPHARAALAAAAAARQAVDDVTGCSPAGSWSGW